MAISGSKAYCGVYASGYDIKTKIKIVKVKKKNGKYKKVRKKVKYKKWRRNNYIYQLTGF